MVVKYSRQKGGNKGSLQQSILTSLLLISVKFDYSLLEAIRWTIGQSDNQVDATRV